MVAFYLDNDVSLNIAAALFRLTHTATTAHALGLHSANDAEQLLTAVQRGAILVTHNYRDFLLLHRAWLRWRTAGAGYALPEHPGILSIPQQRWTDDEAAHELDTFTQTNPALPNMLYQWTPSRGWVARF